MKALLKPIFTIVVFSLSACAGSANVDVEVDVNTEVVLEVETEVVIEATQQLTVADGVFTELQVSAGQQVYDVSCKTCHDMRFYRDALRSWNGRPLIEFWYSILGEMPADNPGSLFEDEYTDVIAYILSENGFPAGGMTLDHNNGMDRINIVSP